MASAAFWQRGESLDYKNTGSTTIEANTIVAYGSRIGVIGCEIAPGEVGSLHVTGVFKRPKTGTSAIAAGADVYWDGDGITEADNDGEGTPTYYPVAGFVASAAAAGDTTVAVKIG